MPSSTIEYARTAQEKALSTLVQSQSAVVDVVETWAKAVENTVQDLPAIPVASVLPTPQEIIKNSYDFMSQVLDAQRKFADQLVKVAAPAVKTTSVDTPADTVIKNAMAEADSALKSVKDASDSVIKTAKDATDSAIKTAKAQTPAK